MAYNTTLAAAVSRASTIDATDTSPKARPTQTQLTTTWEQCSIDVEAQLGGADITIPTSPESKALSWARMVETLMTSGQALINRGAIGGDGEATGPDLVKEAEKKLAWAATEAGKGWLLAVGAETADGVSSGIASSHWTDSPGYPASYEDPEYNHPREFEDGEPW